MILNRTIETKDRVLVPAGTKLTFSNGIAKYQNHPIERNKIPIEAIVGHKGPFINACVATLINDCMRFQRDVRKTNFQDWAHCIAYGDYLIVYIWDTREVIDVISGLQTNAAGRVFTKNLRSSQTGERMTKVVGQDRHGWSKSIYDMLLLPKYRRPDNGLPLQTSRSEWKDIVAPLNRLAIKALMAFESAQVGDEIETQQKLDDIVAFVRTLTDKEVKIVDNEVIMLAEARNDGNWQSKTANAYCDDMRVKAANAFNCLPEEIEHLIVPAWTSETKGTASGIKFKIGIHKFVEQAYAATEREFTDEERKVLADAGMAMPDGSYPIETIEDLDNAIQAFGRTGDDKNETKEHIIAMAKRLNAIDHLPEGWVVANEQVYSAGNGDHISIYRYNQLYSAVRRCSNLPDPEPWMQVGIIFSNKKYYVVVFIWDTRKVLGQAEITREKAFQITDFALKGHFGAIDGGQKLDGSGEAVKAANRFLRY